MNQVLSAFPAAFDEGEAVVGAAAYKEGRRVKSISIAEAGDWSRRPGHVVWIGLLEPNDRVLRQVQTEFGLHDLAIEDALSAHQRPKLEQYGDALFIVARTAQMIDGQIAFGETHLFVGSGYIVSVRHGASASYAAVRQRCEACPTSLSSGDDYILYAILDFIVDNYGPVLESVSAEVDAIEDRVFDDELSRDDAKRLYKLRRDLLRLRNAVFPLVEVCRRLEHSDLVALNPEMRPLYRDVTDHVHRVKEEIDALREVLAFAFEASQMTGQAQQNEVTRKLAAWAAILAVPTAVAGIYGMNFHNMPELDFAYGYFIVILAIAAACTLLYRRFRREGWL